MVPCLVEIQDGKAAVAAACRQYVPLKKVELHDELQSGCHAFQQGRGVAGLFYFYLAPEGVAGLADRFRIGIEAHVSLGAHGTGHLCGDYLFSCAPLPFG